MPTAYRKYIAKLMYNRQRRKFITFIRNQVNINLNWYKEIPLEETVSNLSKYNLWKYIGIKYLFNTCNGVKIFYIKQLCLKRPYSECLVAPRNETNGTKIYLWKNRKMGRNSSYSSKTES